jgi:hypothetical protein
MPNATGRIDVAPRPNGEQRHGLTVSPPPHGPKTRDSIDGGEFDAWTERRSGRDP